MERGKLYVGRGESNRISIKNNPARCHSEEEESSTSLVDPRTPMQRFDDVWDRFERKFCTPKQEKKMDISRDGNRGETTEYFCFDCRQLRLSLIEDKTKCKGCGSKNIVTGKCGELDKQKLKDKFSESRKHTRED